MSQQLDETFCHILADDNCVLNETLDSIPPSGNRERSNLEFIEMMKQFILDDIFRKQFQTKQSFTFSRGLSKSRIDFILISSLLDGSIKDTSIIHFPFSDHDAVRINVYILQSSQKRKQLDTQDSDEAETGED